MLKTVFEEANLDPSIYVFDAGIKVLREFFYCGLSYTSSIFEMGILPSNVETKEDQKIISYSTN